MFLMRDEQQHPFNGTLSGPAQMNRYQKLKSKTSLDFRKQEAVSGSGISQAIYKSAPRYRQATMSPAPHHSVFSARCNIYISRLFYRPYAILAAQPTASKALKAISDA